jgi:hypothetical protein
VNPEEISQPAKPEYSAVKQDAFVKDLKGLEDRADAVDPWRPWFALGELLALTGELRRVRPEYDRVVQWTVQGIASPQVSGPGLAVQAALTINASSGTVKLIVLQDRWSELGSTVDRKLALTLAMVSIYLGVVAIIVAVLPLFL